MTTHTSGAADLPEALRPIQRFEVVDCIDSKHVPAVIPKPHGPWVRYEDHVAALAAGQVTAAPAQKGVAYAALPTPYCYEFREPKERYTTDQMRAFADATHALRIASHGQAPAQPAVKYVPVKADLRDKHWNHPRDDEPRTEACQKALRDRGDDEGQGLDGYWKWGFAAGFNAALATTPSPQAAQQAPAGESDGFMEAVNELDALYEVQPAPATQQAVGNSGFDHKTAADFLSGKTVSDEALRKFVAASRGAHADRAALRAQMLALRGVLASREAEIALLKRSLLDAEAAALQPSPTAQAAECVPAVDGSLEVADAMADSQYLAGVSAGWNAANADDPNAALQKLHESRAGYLKPLSTARASADSVLEDAARLTTEQEYAIRQGHEIAASEAYFGARSKLDTNRNHNIFTAGFERGWDAARKQGANHD